MIIIIKQAKRVKEGKEVQVPSIESAFPHWMATDRRCLKYEVALELPDCQEIFFPRSFTKDSVRGPNTPVDSIEIGMKI